jgi:hypothetical protein
MLLIGVASGCNWAETLSARLPNGFGQVARPGTVFLGGKLLNHRQRKMWLKPVLFNKPEYRPKHRRHAGYGNPPGQA